LQCLQLFLFQADTNVLSISNTNFATEHVTESLCRLQLHTRSNVLYTYKVAIDRLFWAKATIQWDRFCADQINK